MKLMKLACVPLALLAVGIIRALAPWKRVRLGQLWSPRLGHLIGNTECYLCERDALIQPRSYDIWFHSGIICNRVIARKYGELLHLWPAFFANLVVKVNALFLGWEKHMVQSAQVDRDIYNLTRLFSPHIRFTESEERKGQRLLRKLGIPEGAKWVCLIVRDSAYLKIKSPGADFSYHDYRDSDISDYIPAAVELARRGYYVVRMGEVIGKTLLVKHSRVIDYALGKRTEFGDLYLGAKCAFCLGTSTGFMVIPQVFNRPVGIVNYVPVEYTPTWLEGLVIWKHHLKDGKKMALPEIVQAGVGLTTFGHAFADAGITLQDNSSLEILDLAIEMADRDERIYVEEPQTKFWEAFPRSMVNGKPLHGKIRIRVGREFFKGLCESAS